MKLVSVTNPEKAKATLTIQVEADVFEKACEAAYQKKRKNISVPGFRPGKATRAFIEKTHGEGVFYDDAIDATYGIALDAAVTESKIDAVSRPELEITEISKDKGYTFTATFFLKPEVSLKEYKGITAEKDAVSVTDEEVNDEITRRQERAGSQEASEGAIALKDTAVIDFEGFVDGVAFEGGKGEKFSLGIGSGQFIPGFEEQLVGKKAGESCDVKVTFPEEYHAPDLAGKEAIFKVTIHEVKTTVLPALDDEFAKDVSEFDTLAELKADIKEKQLASKEKAAQDAYEGKIIDTILEGMECEVPECMYEAELGHMEQDFDSRLRSQGMNIDTYLQMSGMDRNSFRDVFRPQAERHVKTRLMLEYVANAENITVSDEDLNAEYEKMAEGYKASIEEIRAYIPAESLKQDLRLSKASDLIKGQASSTAPAKKPAAKKAAAPKAEGDAEKAPAAKKAPAKKPAAAKAADATEKAPAKKTAAKTDTAEKAPAKKPAAKSATAKTTAAKKTEGAAAPAKPRAKKPAADAEK